MTTSLTAYESWTRDELIARINTLENRLSNPHCPIPSKPDGKPFTFSAYPRRKIALKFCYSGWEYNGLAYQTLPTSLPTVEGRLFEALAATKLVDPKGGFEACGWEKCGRTDKGVSAAGQVVSLWVRSALGPQDAGETANLDAHTPTPSGSESHPEKSADITSNDSLDGDLAYMDSNFSDSSSPGATPVSGKSELRYVTILNRVLPPTIRILAWSPVSPMFSARFGCQYRHYKYFFSSLGLDLPAMRAAAARLVGEHDFRNLCKIDGSKQLTSFKRRILRAEINSVDDNSDTYVLDLVGTAFLYHQVRNIMAVVFMVGSRLEHPSVITSLVNVDPEHPYQRLEGDPPLEVVETKPEYQMADGLPLMLWDCGYADADVQWRSDNDHDGEFKKYRGGPALYGQLQSIHERSVTYTTLNAHFLAAASKYHPPPTTPPLTPPGSIAGQGMVSVPLGGGAFSKTSKYVPLLRRNRMSHFEVTNERWKAGKGLRKDKRKKGDSEVDDGDNGDD